MAEKDNTYPTGTQRENSSDESEEAVLQGPGSLALFTLMAGPHISVFAALSTLSRLSASIVPKIGVILASIGYPILYLVLLLWKAKWYWPSLIVVFAHIICAALYYFLFRKLYTANRGRYRTQFPRSATQEKKYVLAGMLGGISLVTVLGAPFALFFLLMSDKILLTLMPLAFDDATSIYMLIIAMLNLAGSGLIAGGWAGRLALKISPLRALSGSLGLVLISLLWFFFLIILIMLPAFLSSQANYTMGSAYSLFLFGNLLIGCWWTAYILMRTLKPISLYGRFRRIISVPVICFSSAFLFGVVFGYPADWYHSAGKYFEKSGRLATALWCYEQGLTRNPTGPHAGYLQYRIALGNHKLGNTDRAVRGFREVVSMFNYDETLVSQANQFLDNIERNEGRRKKRVVLPGVDNPTTYRSSYCVPNSLALVMNFWKANVDADDIGKQITGLSSGTMTVDQTWYAEQNGFRHGFIPMATISDIKKAIDAGFPVMVYVPQHVFVILGYDEQLETFVTYDVATRDVWVEYIQKDFIKTWKKESSTMILAFPVGMETKLPEELTAKMEERDDSYFQYHLHQLQALGQKNGNTDHLEYAAAKDTAYFFPVVAMFRGYPAFRSRIVNNHDTGAITEAIQAYYERDFDEGVHLAGQYDDYGYADGDDNLNRSLDFLIGTGRLQETKHLIETIEADGIISDDTSETLSMVNLAIGDTEQAVRQLEEQSDSQLSFYLAQSYLEQGRTGSAIPELIKIVGDCICHYQRSPVGPREIETNFGYGYSSGSTLNKTFNDNKTILGLDKYGNPAIHMANDILAGIEQFGTEAKELESAWYEWMQYNPFDVKVASRLSKLFTARIDGLDPDRDANRIQQLQKKLALTKRRSERYGRFDIGKQSGPEAK